MVTTGIDLGGTIIKAAFPGAASLAFEEL